MGDIPLFGLSYPEDRSGLSYPEGRSGFLPWGGMRTRGGLVTIGIDSSGVVTVGGTGSVYTLTGGGSYTATPVGAALFGLLAPVGLLGPGFGVCAGATSVRRWSGAGVTGWLHGQVRLVDA